MKRGLMRVCVVFLLLLSVPFQAMAAGSGGCCLRAYLGLGGESGPAPASAHETPCEHEVSSIVATPGDQLSKHNTHGPTSPSRCKACPACSLGAVAPPPRATVVSSSYEHDSPLVSSAAAFLSYIPQGLERPPKFLSRSF